ncbi:MAG: hypothetical protein O7I93_18450 [Gemmatimonadetes bacterium]|nr:hypothetical protein [Gemmatimonadota bacterium]
MNATASAQSSVTEPSQASPADVESIEAILHAVYDVISGDAGEPRNWDRMRSLFIPGARLIPTGGDSTGARRHTVQTLEQWIASSGAAIERIGFFERELQRVAERYGHIAHVFSTYDSRRTASDAEPFARGINSFQLWNDGTRWWVVTIFWEGESPGNPIPAEYLRQ